MAILVHTHNYDQQQLVKAILHNITKISHVAQFKKIASCLFVKNLTTEQ